MDRRDFLRTASMAADGIVRLSKIEVHPQHLGEYMTYAAEVGEISPRTESITSFNKKP